MRHVVFVAPFPAETTLRFLRALHSLADVRVSVVAHSLPQGKDRQLYQPLARVEKPMDVQHLRRAVASLKQRWGQPTRIVGLLEPLQVALAQLREDFGVEGTDVATAQLFRDKAKMKDALRAAGLPCARHQLLSSAGDGHDFADELGFPIVVKPPAGMGCKATWRIHDERQLKGALAALRASRHKPVLAEEMLRGREHSHETVTVAGEVKLSSITNYHPTPLEVMENPWIQWVIVAPRDVDTPQLADVHQLGKKAVTALGLQRGMTHMEWFRRDDGSVAIGEIAARPPGANIERITGLAYDTSMYRAWARALVDDAFDGPWQRRYATASVFLRGSGHGRVVAVDGVARAHAAVGDVVVEARIPSLGSPKSDSYEGDGYILLRHPDTSVVEQAAQAIIDTVRVYYG